MPRVTPNPAVTTHFVERRITDRSTGEPPRLQLVALILGMYREMPGLRLTLPQAARMFGLRETTAAVVMNDLVRQDLLRRGNDGRFAAVTDVETLQARRWARR